MVVCHDNAYSELYFDDFRAPSFLETSGAMDVGVGVLLAVKGLEHDRLALGIVAGNPRAWSLPAGEDEPSTSGMFEAVQQADDRRAAAATNLPTGDTAVYERRRDLVAEALGAIGLEVDPPKATPYFWVRVPEGHSSASFTELVLEEAGVVVSPGLAYGPSGEGFFRLSLTVTDDELEEAVRRIESSLRSGIIRA